MAHLTAMDSYLNEIARYPLMTASEEIRLGRLIQKAQALKNEGRALDQDEQRLVKRAERAKRRFVEANLRLVVYIAKKYASRQPVAMDILDLVQEGSVGLMRAAEMFDPERGYKFSTYCYWWCRQAMTRALQVQERLIRRPHTVIELASKMPRAITEETERLGRPPSTAELAVKLRVKEAEIHLLLERGRPVCSLDAMVANVENKTLIETVPDPSRLSELEFDEAMDLELKTPALKLGLSMLEEQERRFIELRFGLNGNAAHTYEGIAKELGLAVSRERIRQILDRSIKKLRYQLAVNCDPLVASRKTEALDAAATAPPARCRQPQQGARRSKPVASLAH